MEVQIFIPLIIVLLLVYCLVGLLVFMRKDRKQISSRSPILLLISHFGNICQSAALLVEMTPRIMDLEYGDVLESAQVFCHFLFYFPYLLRGYRLYFVFHTSIGNGEHEDKYFLMHIRRSKQWWLVKVLIVMMTPVTLLCVALIVVPRAMGFGHYTSRTGVYERIYIPIAFSEQMLFIIGIYLLRHVEQDYSMNRELFLVCFFWYFNVLFSGHSEFSFWMYELLVRNTVIMCVSLLIPLLMSYKRPEMKDTLTLQSVHSLQLVLENPLPHEYFEQFLKTPSRRIPSDPARSEMEDAGDVVLQLYCLCCVYRAKPCFTHAEELITELIDFRKQYSILPESTLKQLQTTMQNEGATEDLAEPAETFLFDLLENFYFPKFKQSRLFGLLCRFVEQSELRSSRIKITSLMGEESI